MSNKKYCTFCKSYFLRVDNNHWSQNGGQQLACKFQRADYRRRNRDYLNKRQNEIYKLTRKKLPSKEEYLLMAKEHAKSKGGLCLSDTYINCKKLLIWYCNKHRIKWKACWNNVGHSNTWCRECSKESRKKTVFERYGVFHISQNSDIRLKAARKANNIVEIRHWKTGDILLCQGSYELKVCDYFNKNKINYDFQITFNMPNDKTYTIDFYLPDSDLYIEVKGHMYPDAKKKWDWFNSLYKNSELWGKDKLEALSLI